MRMTTLTHERPASLAVSAQVNQDSLWHCCGAADRMRHAPASQQVFFCTSAQREVLSAIMEKL